MAANRTISLNIPHRLSQQEVRTRIQAAVGEVHQRFAGNLAHVEEHWSGDHMDFRLGVMGQTVSGRVDVEPQRVRLEVDLPWLFAMLADTIRPRLEQEGRKLLEQDPPKR